jgi:hypothetical protein
MESKFTPGLSKSLLSPTLSSFVRQEERSRCRPVGDEEFCHAPPAGLIQLASVRSIQNLPERIFEITKPGEPIFEEFLPQHGQGAVKERAMPLGEMNPAIAPGWMRAGNVEDQRGQGGDFRVGMLGEGGEAGKVLRGDLGLMEESQQFFPALSPVARFARQALAFPANVIAVAAARKCFVRAEASADSARVAHGERLIITGRPKMDSARSLFLRAVSISTVGGRCARTLT